MSKIQSEPSVFRELGEAKAIHNFAADHALPFTSALTVKRSLQNSVAFSAIICGTAPYKYTSPGDQRNGINR